MTVRRLKLWIFEWKKKRERKRERKNQRVSSRGVNTDLKWSPRTGVLNMGCLLKMMPGHWAPLLTKEPEIINLASVTALDSGFSKYYTNGFERTQTKLHQQLSHSIPWSGLSLTWAKERGCPLKGVPPVSAETLSRWEQSVGLSRQAWEDTSSPFLFQSPGAGGLPLKECLPLKLLLGVLKIQT